VKNARKQLRRIKVLIGIVIAGLIGSGLSAFSLLRDRDDWIIFVHAFCIPEFVRAWIRMFFCTRGLATTYAAYPFIVTAPIGWPSVISVIALFLVGAFFDPVRNVWVFAPA